MAVARLLPAVAGVTFALAAKGVSAAGGFERPGKRWIELHGWLMWLSMGFLLPLGIILLRYSRNQRDPLGAVSPARVKTLFYLHAIILSAAALVALAGILLLVVKLGPFWDYTHQRLGLSLLVLMLLQPLIGLARPGKFHAIRPYWYLLHWTFGTAAVFLGIINVYSGIRIYELIFKTSIRSLNIAFSIQVAFMCLAYLLQDRWSYVFRNRRIHSSKADFPTGNGAANGY